jgi:hypothetical protein
MFKVIGSDNLAYDLVDTREEAARIIEQKKLGRNAHGSPGGNNATKASTMSFRVDEVPAKGNHPGYMH